MQINHLTRKHMDDESLYAMKQKKRRTFDDLSLAGIILIIAVAVTLAYILAYPVNIA